MLNAAALARSRGDQLAARFAHIAATRMAGLPLAHPGLQVAALGFEPLDDGACGVLVTPWCMNLVWLPLGQATAAAPGQTRQRGVGSARFDFIGSDDEALGGFEACSLFSPMPAFADQAAARATALAVLQQLRPALARQGFLLGRRSPA